MVDVGMNRVSDPALARELLPTRAAGRVRRARLRARRGRARPRGDAGGRGAHAGPGWRRAADHRDADGEHGPGRLGSRLRRALLRVGLTGGIASGKTRVLQRLAARGCATLDLDQAARDVVAPGSAALAEIEAAFGPSVLRNGALDRAALGALVFEDAAARVRLNAIVHPRVLRAGGGAGLARSRRAPCVVTDAALLVETGAHLRFDRLVVVHCEPELQLARLLARDGLAERRRGRGSRPRCPSPRSGGSGTS